MCCRSPRLEKRVQALENSLRQAQKDIQEREKRVEELNSSLKNAKTQFDQEKIWREKEESAVEKEKKQERVLQEELTRARISLDQELTSRIKSEAELKELRRTREEQATEIRQLNARGMDLDRKLGEALKELKVFRDENAELKQKKEDDEWVAKGDYKRLEVVWKRARWEIEQFKRKIPEEQWPSALKPRRPGETPASAPSGAPNASPAPSAASVPPESPAPAPEAVPPETGPAVPTGKEPAEPVQPPQNAPSTGDPGATGQG